MLGEKRKDKSTFKNSNKITVFFINSTVRLIYFKKKEIFERQNTVIQHVGTIIRKFTTTAVFRRRKIFGGYGSTLSQR